MCVALEFVLPTLSFFVAIFCDLMMHSNTICFLRVPHCFLHYSLDIAYVPADVMCYSIDLFGVYRIPEDKYVWVLWHIWSAL